MKKNKSISLEYRKIDLKINFTESIVFDVFPAFIFRSVLGKELKRFACILHENHCDTCSLRQTCAYSIIFESPIPKENNILPGRNYAEHPFILFTHAGIGEEVRSLILHITVLGKAIDYFPYMYYALQRAGENGILRNRTKYFIKSVNISDKQIIDKQGNISNDDSVASWSFNNDPAETKAAYKIYFITPIRMKINGSYNGDFNAIDFFNSSWRRASQLVALYGNNDEGFSYFPSEDLKVISKDLKWVDLERWSSRQGRKMKLGGFLGNIEIAGKFSSEDISILQFDEIFHVGKNTGFGLGNIGIEKIK